MGLSFSSEVVPMPFLNSNITSFVLSLVLRYFFLLESLVITSHSKCHLISNWAE